MIETLRTCIHLNSLGNLRQRDSGSERQREGRKGTERNIRLTNQQLHSTLTPHTHTHTHTHTIALSPLHCLHSHSVYPNDKQQKCLLSLAQSSSLPRSHSDSNAHERERDSPQPSDNTKKGRLVCVKVTGRNSFFFTCRALSNCDLLSIYLPHHSVRDWEKKDEIIVMLTHSHTHTGRLSLSLSLPYRLLGQRKLQVHRNSLFRITYGEPHIYRRERERERERENVSETHEQKQLI